MQKILKLKIVEEKPDYRRLARKYKKKKTPAELLDKNLKAIPLLWL